MRNIRDRIKKSRQERRNAIFFSAFILLNIFCNLPLISQQLSENVRDFNTRNFKEELYIRTDRDIYITGEQVWLKIYKMNGLNGSPSNISKVVYLELLDKNNFPLKQIKVKIDGNSGSSDFIIPGKISSGNYVMRAYTNWMQNWPVEQYCYKYISIINPFENIDHIKIPLNSNIADSIAFFPEGGSLIAGIRNKVSIKSFDKNGAPAGLQGTIVNNKGDQIGQVDINDGFGIVTITPASNDKLFLSFNGINGISRKIPLPDIKDSGFSLNIDADNNKSLYILRILKGSNISTDGLNLVIYSEGIVLVTRTINSRDSIISFSQSEFPDGLSEFLLIDKEGNNLAQRSVYKGIDEQISYKVSLSKPEYSTREKVTIGISATDNAGNPVEGDISISVAKSATINSTPVSGSKGFRLSGVMFNNNASREHINDYMITVPGEWFSWKDVLNPPKIQPDFIPEIEGHLINGFIKVRETGEPLKNAEISLSYVGKAARCKFTKTDEKGEFYFVVKDAGLNEIVIQPLSPDIIGYYVDLKQPFNNTFSNYRPPVFFIDSSKIDLINNAIISAQVNNIYQPYQKDASTTLKPVMTDFYGKPENTILMSDYIELTSVREVVKEIIPNVYTMKQSGKYDFKLINKFRGQPFENKPLILVDGVPIFDIEKVLSINSKEIERADIINTRYYFSENIFDGVVSFITKKGNLSALEFDNSIFRQAYEACQIPVSFYSPDYSSSALKQNRIPDYRNTLYWKPDVHTGKDGKTEVEFYTSDEAAVYTILVEGISPDGKTGLSSASLVVKQGQ